ncbi:MAG: TlpA family protein disulfide reductase [Gemmatimonadaceae bacterium]|nr:TlpA family protein disulfide reductase [Gemmatimonadaceae bacterium]
MKVFRSTTARHVLPTAAIALVGLLALPSSSAVAQAGSGTSGAVAGVAVGSMAPADLTLETLDGKPYALSTLIGKRPVVIEFWATWCPLCRKLEPQLQAARQQHGDRVAFVGIGVPENQSAERQQQYITEKQMSGLFLFDRTNSASKAFRVPHTSYLVVLDAKGTVVYTGVGADQNVEEAVRRALPTR